MSIGVKGSSLPKADRDSRIRLTRSVFFQAVRRNHQRSMLKNDNDQTY